MLARLYVKAGCTYVAAAVLHNSVSVAVSMYVCGVGSWMFSSEIKAHITYVVLYPTWVVEKL